jgi:hypothetical protein
MLYRLHVRRTNHNPPRAPSVVTSTLVETGVGANDCRCSRDQSAFRNKFFVTHPMTDQCCLTSAIAPNVIYVVKVVKNKKSFFHFKV